MELIEQLDGTAMRDQRPPPSNFATLEEQRAAVHKSATAIKNEAIALRNSMQRLRNALRDFERSLGEEMWSAAMLEETFEISFIPSTHVEPPEIFDPLRGFFHTRQSTWKEIECDLHALATLPVREKRRTNRVRNHSLEQALSVCRLFWRDELGRSWSRSSLTHPDVLERDQRGQLQGKCERFVSDMLTAAGIEFTLRSLNGAWSALDKRLGGRG